MATTTNYGWTTPDDTALVKDGAAAIRTLGSSVDTTTKALNPSTTLGDIEYRSSTANTNTRLGIGTSGQALTVVAGAPSWAASATSVLTTTGDTLYASAANTLARLGIGSTGNVLTVAGGVPTWAAPAGGAPTIAQIATGNINSGTSLTISSLSSYDTLILYMNGITFASFGDPLSLQINSVAASGNYRGAGGNANNSVSIQQNRYTGNDQIPLTGLENMLNTSAANTFLIVLTNCKAAGFTTWQYSNAFRNNANVISYATASGIYTSAAAVSNLKIFTDNTATFNGSGTYTIYGG